MQARFGRKAHFEKVPLAEALSLLVRHNRSSCYRVDWHYHPEVELVLVVRGQGMRFVGDCVEAFCDGDLCLLGANLPHARHSQTRPDGVHSIVIQFLPKAWGDAFLALPETSGLRRLIAQATRGLQVTGATRQWAAELIQSMALRSNDGLGALVGLLEVLSLLADSTDLKPLASAKFRPDLRQDAGRRLTRVFEAIEASPGSSQQEIANLLGMSPQSFSRFFKRQVGKTYVDYLNEWRINRACQELLGSDRSVLDIACEAGFNNLSHFNRQFRRCKGTTPSQFRRGAGPAGCRLAPNAPSASEKVKREPPRR